MIDRATELYQQMSDELFLAIARRLRLSRHTDITYWQAKALSELGMFTAETVDELAKHTGRSQEFIYNALIKHAEEIMSESDMEFKKAGQELKPSQDIKALAKAYFDQMFINLDNYVNQTVLDKSFSGTVARTYQNVVGQTSIRFSSGLMTLDQALARSLTELAEKGMQSHFRDISGRRWNVQSYVRTLLKTTNARMYNELRISRAEEHGVYTMLVTSKPDARDACRPIQGKVVDTRQHSKSGYPSIYDYGYGTPAGHRGVNCGHMWIPWFEGISVNNQREYDDEEVKRNTDIRNRRNVLANRIRNTKRNVRITEELGSESADHYKSLLRRQQADMRRFVKENDLKRDYSWERIYI